MSDGLLDSWPLWLVACPGCGGRVRPDDAFTMQSDGSAPRVWHMACWLRREEVPEP